MTAANAGDPSALTSASISIVGGRALVPGGRLTGADETTGAGVTISGNTIEAFAVAGPADGHRIDAEGLIVSPGFIDLQINGGFGVDLVSDPEGMWQLGRQLPRHGVTGFLPTIITSPPSRTAAAIKALAKRPQEYVGAEPLGLHFEGPMLSPSCPGAHPVQHLASPDSDLIIDWSRGNGVALVTIAPELANAPVVIAELVGRGVTVSAGHSEATAEQTRRGMEAGITLVTHLFNAMSPLHHRNPNLVGVALAEPKLAASLIIDGVHLAPDIVAAVWLAKGADGIVVITDAVAPMGMGPGTYQFADMTTTADRTEVRTQDGILAGSILTMDRAVRNLVSYAGCEPQEALRSATATPARAIGETRRGRIEPGAVADLVLLDDELCVQLTLCRGRIAYVADGARDRVAGELLEFVDAGTP